MSAAVMAPSGAGTSVAQGRPSDPVAFIAQLALDERIDGTKLQILWDLQKDILAEQRKEHAEKARVDFFAALSDVQRDLPIIGRDAKNPHTSSSYARLETIWEQCRPVWVKLGFAVTFDAKMEDGLIHVFLRLSHKNGHVETYHAPGAPSDSMGSGGRVNKTAVQGNQSTITYLKRGLLCSALGIVTANEDDDGAGGAAPVAVVQRRGRDMPPIARAEEPIYPPRQAAAPTANPGVMTQFGQELVEEKRDAAEAERRAKWHAKLRENLDGAETADEVEAIVNRPSVKQARENWPMADRKLIEDLIKQTYDRLSEIFSHPNGEADWGESPDSPPWEQETNESGR